ncbi:Gamma-tubulin complex component protein [Trinorchestia longiramus]|nr:Gamma-tubulin complex component protein [Trinorchestia longiramus]
MIQELLLALLGCDGPIFLNKKLQFQVQGGVFSEWEEALLSRVLELASHYSELLNFCNSNSRGQGRYRAALAAALVDAIRPYKCAVVELEREVLSEPSLSLTHVLTTLQPYAPTLSVLASLVADVEEGEVRGCRLLETVHCHCQNAVHHTALLNRSGLPSCSSPGHLVCQGLVQLYSFPSCTLVMYSFPNCTKVHIVLLPL